MIEAEGKILKWGNSFGIRLNKNDLLGTDLKVDDNVKIKLEKKYTTGKDIFGTLKKKGDTQKELDEIDEMFGEW